MSKVYRQWQQEAYSGWELAWLAIYERLRCAGLSLDGARLLLYTGLALLWYEAAVGASGLGGVHREELHERFAASGSIDERSIIEIQLDFFAHLHGAQTVRSIIASYIVFFLLVARLLISRHK